MLTDTVAELGWVVGRAEVEEADLQQLEVPVEAQRVRDLLTASFSTESMAWNALLNHCVQVLNREADWDQSQVDSAERLLLQARVDRLEAELELRDLVRTPSAQAQPQAVQETERPGGFVQCSAPRPDLPSPADGAPAPQSAGGC